MWITDWWMCASMLQVLCLFSYTAKCKVFEGDSNDFYLLNKLTAELPFSVVILVYKSREFKESPSSKWEHHSGFTAALTLVTTKTGQWLITTCVLRFTLVSTSKVPETNKLIKYWKLQTSWWLVLFSLIKLILRNVVLVMA